MSRRPNQTYSCHDLEDLTRQLLFVPADKRAEQVRRAEKLHDQIDPQANYPIDFLKFRITSHRSAEDDEAVLVGQAVLADLRMLIETLSRGLSMPLITGEAAESPEALAKRLNVTARTINRWRKTGLRVRWVKLPEHPQPRLMILRSAADHFIAKHNKKVQKAAAFTQMSAKQRSQLFQRARRLTLAREVNLNQVASHLAKRTGRALETLRQMLLQHDIKNPDNPIFIDRSAPLTPRQQEVITRAHKRGVTVRLMAVRFNRTHSTIYRAIRQRRAAEIRKINFSFHAADIYQRDDADQVILRPVRMSYQPCELKIADLPPELDALYTQPSLTATAQQRLLIQLNYLKYKIMKLRDALDRYEPRIVDMHHIDAIAADIKQRRSLLARANLSLVLSTTQRHRISSPQTGPAALVELLSLGNQLLFNALDQFDPNRNENFTSFLTYRLQRRFALVEFNNPKAHRKLDAKSLATVLLEQAQAADFQLNM